MKFHCSINPFDKNFRHWPYPYLAGVSISNDAEFLEPEVIESLLMFANSNKNTPLGDGLNLSLSTSLFFYSNGNSGSIFSGLGRKPAETAWASRAIDLIAAGLVDTNHAFGEFDTAPDFVREHAEHAYNWMAKRSLQLPVYTNHGGRSNHQNVGTDADYHRGDDQQSPAYHSDMFKANNVRFVWTDSMSYESQAGDTPNLPVSITQERRRDKLLRGLGLYKERQPVQVPQPPLPKLRDQVTLQDGSIMNGFRRYRGTGANAPNVSSFLHQVRSLLSSSIYDDRGAAVIYQHFGVLFRENGECVRTSVSALQKNTAGFLSAWHLLAREFHEGRLWLPTLADYLRYVRAIESVNVVRDADGLIELSSPSEDLDEHDLSGLTIYSPPNIPTSVRFKGRPLDVTRNGPDETGRYSVTITNDRNATLW